MRVFLASIVSGFIGFIQVLVIMVLESRKAGEGETMVVSDIVALIIALLIMAECVCVIAFAMYRYSPWILRLLREDPWEIDRIGTARRKYGHILQYVTVCAVILRRILVMADSQNFSHELIISLGVALLPFIVPSMKPLEKLNHGPTSRLS